MKIFAIAFLLFCFLFTPAWVFANPPPNENELPLQQDHGSVCIGFQLNQHTSHHNGNLDVSSDLENAFRIRRYIGEEMTEIVAARQFTAGEALAHRYECGHTNNDPYVSCNQNPELCIVCNGDDIPDCSGTCYEMLYFVIADLCAPAGEAEYKMEELSDIGDWYDLLYDTIQIEPSAGECTDMATSVCQEVFWVNFPSDEDDDNDSVIGVKQKDDDNNDSGGCTVSRGDPLLSLLGVMSVIGLVALAISWRRGH
jgi:hypothetical protein